MLDKIIVAACLGWFPLLVIIGTLTLILATIL